MSQLFDGIPIASRAGGDLRVLTIARISTVHQDARSLGDQAAFCEKYVRDRYPGGARFDSITGQGSGEILDRRDLAEAEARVESGVYDVVVVEDLGRICRRNRAIDFCELCEDAGTRLIAVNDSIDTARDDWRLHAGFATMKHESSNKDTSKRICRSQRNRFVQGGVVQTLTYGYIKPPGTITDDQVRKMPEAEPVYEGWATRLEGGASYAEVADWLNALGVPTGEWARSDRWTGTMVGRVTRNPILKGVRRHNVLVSRRHNKSGRHRSVTAPAGDLLLRNVPHLAFIEPGRYDRLIALLDGRNAACARGRREGAPDGRAGVPKKRTVWPGQHVACGVCGRLFYWGGHGKAGYLMCSGARAHSCWNGATFEGADAARRLAGAVLSLAEGLADFDAAFLAEAEAAAAARNTARAERLRGLDSEVKRVEAEVGNLVDAVALMGLSDALRARLAEVEARKARLSGERADLLRRPDQVPPLPTLEELKARARSEVGRLAFDDPGFGRLMHLLVPRVEVFPCRLLDGGKVQLRAMMRVDLAPLLGAPGEALGGLVSRTITVDLFDPPQRAACRERVVALRAAGLTERRAADELGLTVTAAQNAMALHRRMLAEGLADAYVPLTSAPGGQGRLRRQSHARYRFEPLAGYPAWADQPPA